MKSSFSSKNQQVVFISTVLQFYSVEVPNFEGFSTSLWIGSVQVHQRGGILCEGSWCRLYVEEGGSMVWKLIKGK